MAIAAVLVVLLAVPVVARAFWPFDSFFGIVSASSDASLGGFAPALRAVPNLNPTGRGGGDIIVVDGKALVAEIGPEGTTADIEVKTQTDKISLYIVREGDSLSQIAEMFGVSVSTIMWANDISKATAIHAGDELVILPVSGVKYVVKKGDTVASIAKTFKGDADEITKFNAIEGSLAVGEEIIIPNGVIPVTVTSGAVALSPTRSTGSSGTLAQVGYYLSALSSACSKTQELHGYNGIDFGCAAGTPILAAATGDVVIAREGGWNGGYGTYAVIQHDNGSQTLYAHASDLIVYNGQRVVQGQVIGYVGRTGRATGNHLHFEIRNDIRNPF